MAASTARRAGARLVVNPAPARPDHADLLPGALVTPNAGELAAITQAVLADQRPADQRPADQRPAATALSRRTAAPVVVTLGADGALLADQDAVHYFAGHRVEVRDTTGAGDTLTGVLAAGLASGCDLIASVRRAVAASALAVTGAGARTAMPSAAEIDRLLSS
jgi:ribokinase